MKNLVVERELCTQLGLLEDVVAGVCINASESRLYVITGSGTVHCYAQGETLKALWQCAIGPELLPNDDDGGNAVAASAASSWLVSFSHVLELDALCLATRAGAIALLHVGDDTGGQQLEQVGCVDDGLCSLEWSPDGELLAALSGSGNLLVMNQAWELLFEGPAAGPAASTPAPPQHPCDGRITWRGDGKFFAVVSRDPPPPAAAAADGAPSAAGLPPLPPLYRVRIWDRSSLELHATGDAAEGLLPLPAWQPNGRHLYVVAAAAAPLAGAPAWAAASPPPLGAEAQAGAGKAAPPGPAVLLYERNGLRHGGFSLPSAAPVHSMAWSCDSELLALLTAPCAHTQAHAGAEGMQEGPTEWVLQLWHRSNWHWYLKHERRYPPRLGVGLGPGGGDASDGTAGAAEPAPHLRWDEAAGGLLHVVTPAGLYEQVSLAWDVCVSERGTAAVVDGCSVLLTPLRHGLVPPPMCAARLALPEAAVDVAIGALPAPAGSRGSGGGGGGGLPDAEAEAEADEDEVVAVLTSGGRLLLSRSVEEDLFEETLEDQQALAAGFRDGAASPAAASSSAAAGPALLPAAPPLDVPLAGGRRVRALCWLAGCSSLLLLASPYPEPGLEDGPPGSDLLVQVDVEWVSCGPADPTDPRVAPEVVVSERPPVYAGGRVLRLAPHGAGGAAVELAGGSVARFVPGGSGRGGAGEGGVVRPCGPHAALPAPCAVVRSVPTAALASAGHQGEPAPLLGLSRGGTLAWGADVIAASDVTSFAVRTYGPGGPALLFTTRKNLLYTVLFSQLRSYTHRELTADPHAFRGHRRGEGEVQAAMHAAMRPHAATAAARDVAVRAVEAGAVLVACPAGAAPEADGASAAPAAGPCGAAAAATAAGGGGGAAAAAGDGGARCLRPLSERLASAPAVLQMPRGNLEGVAPRGLVLAALLGALRAGRYGEAWRLAAVQRVDLNLLVDYRWPAFLDCAPALVAALTRPADLCDLLFALHPGSVLQPGGPYAGALEWLGEPAAAAAAAASGAGPAGTAVRRPPLPQAVSAPAASAGASTAAGGSGGEGKVAAVCRAVREAVLALPDAVRYLEVVVTSYARSDPPQLEDAMRCIREAKERELAATPAAAAAATATTAAAAGSSSSAADKALKHLLLYVDADELYGTALGMYDMPLAYMVVVNAQKDPGEYLAELARFGAISPPPLQRHAVDVSLRRWGSALRNLVEAGPQHFQQALQLARDKGLLRQLLQLYDSDPERRPAVLDAYGEHLEAAKRYDDAAVSYMAAGQLDKALRAYRAAGRWRMVFVVAGQMQYDEAAVQELAAEVAEELAAGGAAADAAAVLLSYLGDVDNAVRTYCQAHEWREAVRVSHAHSRADLVETVVAPAAAEAAAALLTEARESEERLRKYGSRLADVRARRLAMAAAVEAADEEGGGAGPPDDLQSDVMSLVSGLSVYTDATGVGTPGGAAGSAAGGGGGASASSRAPSTVGGRRAHKASKKLQKAGTRIRAGSPLEEASLVSHVHSLAPRAAVLEEAAQLGELLVLFGEPDDGRTLQRAAAAWQAAYQAVRADIAAHPVPVEGPGHSRAEMERLLTPAPDTSGVAWKWDVLRDFGATS